MPRFLETRNGAFSLLRSTSVFGCQLELRSRRGFHTGAAIPYWTSTSLGGKPACRSGGEQARAGRGQARAVFTRSRTQRDCSAEWSFQTTCCDLPRLRWVPPAEIGDPALRRYILDDAMCRFTTTSPDWKEQPRASMERAERIASIL
jgi:hypothetical protein